MAKSDNENEAANARPSWVRTAGGAHDQSIEENWLFGLRKERFKSRHTGKEHDYYVIHLADAVHVVALTPDDEVLLVRQFRAGSDRDSLEIPGGSSITAKTPARRCGELLEETGYAGDAPVLLGTLWSNPSLLTSRISTIVIRNARPVAEPDPDLHEELTIERVPAHAIPGMILEGKIDHCAGGGRPALVAGKQTLGLLEQFLVFRGLTGGNGYIPCFQAWRGGHDQGWVDLGQFSKGGRRQIVAVFLPVAVDLFHARLHVLSLFIRQVRAE